MPRPLSPANRISQRWQTWLIMPLLACAGVASCEAFSSTASDAGAPADAAYSDIQVSDSKPIGLDGALDGGPNPNLVGTEGMCPNLVVGVDCIAQRWYPGTGGISVGAEPFSIGARGALTAILYGQRGSPSSDGTVVLFDGNADWPLTSPPALIYRALMSKLNNSPDELTLIADTIPATIMSIEADFVDGGSTVDGSTPTYRLSNPIYSAQYIRAQHRTKNGGRLVRQEYDGKTLVTLTRANMEADRFTLPSQNNAIVRSIVSGDNLYIASADRVERRIVGTGVGSVLNIFNTPANQDILDMAQTGRELYISIGKNANDCSASAYVVRIDLGADGAPAQSSPDASAASDAKNSLSAGRVVASNLRCPTSLASDTSAVYWLERLKSGDGPDGGKLQRLRSEGGASPETLQRMLNEPRGLVALSTGLYWIETEMAQNNPNIVRRIRANQP